MTECLPYPTVPNYATKPRPKYRLSVPTDQFPIQANRWAGQACPSGVATRSVASSWWCLTSCLAIHSEAHNTRKADERIKLAAASLCLGWRKRGKGGDEGGNMKVNIFYIFICVGNTIQLYQNNKSKVKELHKKKTFELTYS